MEILTPADVRAAKFDSVKFRTGYDVDAVDVFLEKVAATIEELNRKIERLEARS
jgi:DivIVA domain-containing protein